MDDARLAGEMTIEGIARQLEAIRADINGAQEAIRADITGMKGDITGMKGDITGMKGDITGMKGGIASGFTGLKRDIQSLDARMQDGFHTIDERFHKVDERFGKVDEELNAARIRDGEAHSLLKFGLEAREGLRESMEACFDATDRKHDEEISLLKDVLRSVTSG